MYHALSSGLLFSSTSLVCLEKLMDAEIGHLNSKHPFEVLPSPCIPLMLNTYLTDERKDVMSVSVLGRIT